MKDKYIRIVGAMAGKLNAKHISFLKGIDAAELLDEIQTHGFRLVQQDNNVWVELFDN